MSKLILLLVLCSLNANAGIVKGKPLTADECKWWVITQGIKLHQGKIKQPVHDLSVKTCKAVLVKAEAERQRILRLVISQY